MCDYFAWYQGTSKLRLVCFALGEGVRLLGCLSWAFSILQASLLLWTFLGSLIFTRRAFLLLDFT